jgi:hypothetical protein
MRNKTKSKGRVSTRKGKKVSSRSGARAKKAGSVSDTNPATQRFVNDLLVRGEAAGLTPNGKLPLDATHVIEKKNPDGSAAVKRVRYKLF